ncbi:zinc finger BED domain-containing protein RICESLEEPER 2-like protein [Tanacetum coccineum]
MTKRRNRTLIEAARTMLADSKLPTTFWAEVVNTACYVQNRVLVVKPHNKTPYELFRGRTPALSFIRPFGCYVTILDTLDYLGKFDESQMKDSLFLEDKPIIAGDGPKWLFDIDVLTKYMNYVPVVAGTNSNDFVGTENVLVQDDEGVCKESGIADQEKPENSTQGVNTAGTSINTEPDMFSLGDNATLEAIHVDFFGDETEVDMSNITTTYPVPSTPHTRIHKDHSLDYVIDDVQFGVQTRRMTKTTNEQGFNIEPKKVTQALTDPSWKEAMQDELLQFKLQKVWTLVDLPYDKRAIGTKWVYRNKKDKRGIFVRNKARLVMDVKSAFLYNKIEKEVYVCQPPGFEDLEFPDRVYKVEKALYGLHQAPRACQDNYVDEILKKFGFSTVRIANTPMKTSKPLLKDAEAEDVDVYLL